MVTSVAARTAAFGKRTLPGQTALAAPSAAIGLSSIDGGAGDVIGLKVELYLGTLGWADISPLVYYRDKVKITRGRPDETSQAQPQTAALTLNNRGGTFTPRLATGAYFKLIGRNTPIRISRLNNGVRRYRFAGEVPSWPTTSDISGRDVYEQIQASGPLRRVRQGNRPLRSSMFRAYTQGTTSSLVTAYWPCEDGATATQFASGLSGGTPMTFTGTPQLAQNTSIICSGALPTLNGSIWSAPVPATVTGTGNVMRFLLSVPTAGEFDTAVIARMITTGTVARTDVQYGVGGTLRFTCYDSFGNQLVSSGYQTFGSSVNGNPVRISMELLPGSPSITVAIAVIFPGQTARATSGPITGTIGQAIGVSINPNGSLTSAAVGHVSYQPIWDTLYDLSQPLNAWSGEPPDAVQANDAPFTTSRFTRLCLEQNVNPVVITSPLGFDVDPGPAAPVGMGPQTVDTFSSLLQQVPDTTAGMMFEPRDQVGVAIRTRASLYNQTPRLTLDHSQHQLAAPLNPVDDDQLTRNDVTVTRLGGSSATLMQTTGPLSIQDPPDGVGDYETEYQLSLASDGLLSDAAGWRLHMGTVDEPRYPSISLNLRHPTFTGNVDMMNAALSLDIGDRILIVNPPPELPPDPISLIVQGYSETLGIYEHDMVINCSPESPYQIAILEDLVLGHADTDGSTLSVPISGSDVTFRVATTGAATGSPLWTTSAGDFPFDVNIGGERVTVTSITGGSSPQFFTNVIRGLNCAPIPLGADGTFESGVTGWTPAAGTFVASTAQAHSGTQSGLLTTTGSPTQTYVRTPMIPVTPGSFVAATHWVLTASGSPSCKVAIDFFDAGQNYQSTYSSSATVAPAAWTTQQSVATVPDGIAYAQIGPTMGSSPPTGTAIRVDDVTFVIVPSHATGTDVRLWQPMILSL